MFPLSRSSFSGDRRRGIALLITVILLAFLVVVVVALSSLVRVETQIAVNQDAAAQARQNALSGLNIALGRLQETAGPDKRITARADILGGAPANAYLTGVWDSSGNLVTWLVNGNEDHASGNPVVEPTSTPTSRANANSLILDPTDDALAQNPITRPLYDDAEPPANIPGSLPTSGQPVFSAGHVYLVSGRVDSSKTPDENVGGVDVRKNTAAGAQLGYKNAIGERIILRKSPIIVDGGSVAGMAPNTNVQIGNYAFWVSDDGIKASIGSGNRAGDLAYDDTGATPAGMDYDTSDNGLTNASAATDESYLARKFLNGIQLQATRTDLVLRDNSANDIFRPANRRGLYGVLPHPELSKFLENLVSSQQLNYSILATSFSSANPSVDLGFTLNQTNIENFQADLRDRLRQRFHDITPKSRGVLTDMVNGGLRKDLSFDLVNGFPTLPANLRPGAQAFLNIWRPANGVVPLNSGTPEGVLAKVAPIVPFPEDSVGYLDVTNGNAYYPVVPVMTEFLFRIKFTVEGGRLKANVSVDLELWNPYNVTLRLPAGEDLYLVIPVVDANSDKSYFSDIGLHISDGQPTPTTQTFKVNLARTLGWDGTPQDRDLAFPRKITPAPGSGIAGIPDDEFPPGVVRVFRFTTETYDALDATTFAPINPTGNVVAETNAPLESKLAVELRVGNPPNLTDTLLFFGNTSPLGQVAPITYTGEVNYAAVDGVSFYFRMADQGDYPDNIAWLDNVEPRAPMLVQGGGSVTPAKPAVFVGDSYGWSVLVSEDSGVRFDSDTQQLLLNEQSVTPARAVVYDLPRQEVTTLGSLQHLAFAGTSERSYVLGSPNASAMGSAASANNLFETHFISTVPLGTTAVTKWSPKNGDLLANTSLRIFDPAPNQDTSNNDLLNDGNTNPSGLQTARAAEYLLIEDAFNINSTSVAAWMGVLGGALPALADPNATISTERDDFVWPASATPSSELKANWRYRNASDGVSTFALGNAFFRLPHTATNLNEDYVTIRDQLSDNNRAKRLSAAFRLGVREFTKDKIEVLATNLVNRIKTRARPFVSLAEFIDSGVLDGAISDAGLNTITGRPIPAHATAFIAQGDILQLIAPRLAARSDTFTIRAYGEVTDPTVVDANNPPIVRARAWVEATVQRLPTKHARSNDPADNMTDTGEAIGDFGRVFKVVSLRWLDPSDI